MFTHLHLHSQYSLSEGAIRIEALVKALKERGFDGCAITDHDNMFGAVEFYHAMKKADLKPIIGLGASVIEGDYSNISQENFKPVYRSGQTQLLCQNKQGYKNLGYITSISYTEGKFNNTPLVSHQILEQYQEGLIAICGGVDSEISELLLNDKNEEARKTASWYQGVFEDRFYIELQNTGLPQQMEINQQLVALAEELNIPLVGTNECLYLTPEEAEAQYILWLMKLQKRVTDEDVPPQLTDQRYLKSYEEMQEAFSELPESALENAGIIADQCEVNLDNKTNYLPVIPTKKGESLESKLCLESEEGLNQRLEHLYSLYTPEESFEEFRKEYDERLKFELDVIIKMGFPGYFLIVSDFIKWSKENHVSVGPGRGSGAGSLVAYALLITDVDPLRYGLLFERFLNPDRISMPDFDIDFDVEGRESVIDYVRQHYGEKNVCQISTFGSLKAKAVVRGVARVLNFPYSEADKIAKLIPNDLNIKLDDALAKEPALASIAAEGSDNEQRLIKLSLILEGLSTHLGTHAAGVIIMDQDIREVMPVCTGKEGGLQSMYPMKYAEDQGAVKFDFLGLQNLSTIDNTLNLLKKSRPEAPPLDISSIAMDDPLTFELLCNADTTGVFQLESSGMKRLVGNMKPSVFEDIVAILALYRPGPLGSGMVEDFVQCKHGHKKVVYPHPLMSEILKETYGVLVYQEQIMQSVQVLAGFTLGQADLLRRAIGKKIAEILVEQRSKFVEGCLNNPIYVEQCPKGTSPEDKANEIFDTIDYFSGYGFNKSHTVAYGLVSYQTAYLKAHYPVQFMAALLNGAINNQDNVILYISECKEMGIKVLPPDVNTSDKKFTVQALEYHISSRTIANFEIDFAGKNADLQTVPEEWVVPLRKLLKRIKNFETPYAAKLIDVLCKNVHLPESGKAEDIFYVDSPFMKWLEREARIEVIRFGLNGVKNVGGKAVDAILKVREENGTLNDFMEFMKKVDLHEINKRMVETLIKCGAFDSLHSNRAQLFASLDDAFHLTQEFQRANSASQQSSLFDLMDQDDVKATETKLVFPQSRNWTKKEMLKHEKEAIGFYVSGHPLDRYASEIKHLATTTVKLKAGDHKEKNNISLLGIVVNNTVRMNQSLEKFAIVLLEDSWGKIEFPVFSGLYNESGHLLDSDEPILVTGRVNLRDDEYGLFVESIKKVSEIRENDAKSMTIRIGQNTFTTAELSQLKESLQKYSGNKPYCFEVTAQENTKVIISPADKLSFNSAMTEEIEELLPNLSLAFRYH